MQVAILHSDFQYRTLVQVEVLPGNEAAVVGGQLFIDDQPIGSMWVPPEVSYWERMPPEPDDCEACLSPEELAELSESKKPVGDFPHFWGINFGVLTERSFAVLRPLIEPFVEFLPLRSSDGQFTAFKVHCVVDALDLERSKIEWVLQLKKDLGKPRIARRVMKFVFHENRLVGQVIFRIPQLPLHIFVTETVMNAVHENQLTGFRLEQVWPPIDERAKFLEKRSRKKGKLK